MKRQFLKPLEGPGLSGSEMVPIFGSEDCPSMTKFVEVEEETDKSGRVFAVNPTTGERVYE